MPTAPARRRLEAPARWHAATSLMTVAGITRLGLGRVISPPVFINGIADFAEARKFTRQFQDLDGSEILHRVGWWVAQRFEQADAVMSTNSNERKCVEIRALPLTAADVQDLILRMDSDSGLAPNLQPSDMAVLY